MKQQIKGKKYSVAEVEEAIRDLEGINLPSLAPTLEMFKRKLAGASSSDPAISISFTPAQVQQIEEAKPRIEAWLQSVFTRPLKQDLPLAEQLEILLPVMASNLDGAAKRVKEMDTRLAFRNAAPPLRSQFN